MKSGVNKPAGNQTAANQTAPAQPETSQTATNKTAVDQADPGGRRRPGDSPKTAVDQAAPWTHPGYCCWTDSSLIKTCPCPGKNAMLQAMRVAGKETSKVVNQLRMSRGRRRPGDSPKTAVDQADPGGRRRPGDSPKTAVDQAAPWTHPGYCCWTDSSLIKTCPCPG